MATEKPEFPWAALGILIGTLLWTALCFVSWNYWGHDFTFFLLALGAVNELTNIRLQFRVYVKKLLAP